MRELVTKIVFFVLCACASSALFARAVNIQALETYVDGQKVRFVVTGDNDPALFCDLKIDYGDGDAEIVRIGRREKFPLVRTRVYPVPGVYLSRAEGSPSEFRAGCEGSATAKITIVERDNRPGAIYQGVSTDSAAVTASRAVRYVNSCPTGWQKVYEDENTGAFTCQLILPNIVCSTGSHPFRQKDVIGCRANKQ